METRTETVMIVDASRSSRETLAAMMSDAGYHVVAVADGREALQRGLLAGEIDLLVCDQDAGTMEGTQLLRSVRAALLRTAAIMVTYSQSQQLVIEWLRLGGDDFFLKPVDPRCFLPAAEAAIYSSRHKVRLLWIARPKPGPDLGGVHPHNE
ncbi:MAG: response regulator [Nitrospirota bacterium]